MSRSLLVSRTSLTLADLQLWAPGSYVVKGDTFGPGTQTLRRQVATSPYTTSRALIGYVKDTQTAPMSIEVQGTSGSDLDTKVGALLDAFGQMSYTLAFSWDGLAGSWACEPADYAVGDQGVFEDLDTVWHTVAVNLLVPHSPVPLTGTI